MALTDNLLAFYKLDNTNDSSGNNRTLTDNGNVSFASGKIGNAAVFDGSNYLTASFSSFGPIGTGDFTASVWVKFNNLDSSNPHIISFDSGFALGVYQLESGTRVDVNVAGVGGMSNVITEQSIIGNWTHFLIRRISGVVYTYVNGALTTGGDGSYSGDVDLTGTEFYIGCHPGPILNVDGQIDAVGIWNRALSEQEVATLYNSGTGLELPAAPAVKNGWINNIYWINDVATSLDQNGSGTWNNTPYYNGSVQNNGWNGYAYFISGTRTTLNSSGNGEWNGNHYVSGSVFTDGYDSTFGVYYIGGVKTTLDSNGNGDWNGDHYVSASVFTDGYDSNNGIYYIGGLRTTLDQNGSGGWGGKLYASGSLFSGSKGGLTFVDGVAQPLQAATAVGTNVAIAYGSGEDVETAVTLTFDGISVAGTTTVEQIVPSVIPTGYSPTQSIVAFSIETTAEFTGNVNLDLVLPSSISQAMFDRCKIFHVKNNGDIDNLTRVSSNFATRTITVLTPSFSDFVVLDNTPHYDATTGKYYINGQETTLDQNGFGWYNGNFYRNGSIDNSYTGTYSTYWVINGVQTTLTSNGNGDWNGQHYRFGSVFTNGYDSNNDKYYINGAQTTLNMVGTGTWNGQSYINGVIQNGGGGGSKTVKFSGKSKFAGKVKFA